MNPLLRFFFLVVGSSMYIGLISPPPKTIFEEGRLPLAVIPKAIALGDGV